MMKELRNFLAGTVRRRLISGVGMVLVIAMTFFVVDMTLRQQEFLLAQQEEEARFLAQSVAISAAGWLAARDISGLQEIMRAQLQHPDLEFAMALDMDGLVLAHTATERRGQYVLDLPEQAQVATLSRGSKLVDVVSPAFVGKQQVGWIRIGLGQQQAMRRLSEIMRDGVLYGLGAVFAGLLVAVITASRLTARLRRIQGIADQVRSGRREARVELGGSDEAAVLANQFNEMLDVLAMREQMLRQTQAIAHLGSWEYELKTNRLVWSDEVYEIFGMKPQQVRVNYESFLNAVHPDDRERVNSAYWQSVRTGQHDYEVQHRIVRPDTGEVRHVHEKCHHVYDASGSAVRSVGMVHDITEMQEVTMELERNRDYLQQLIEVVPDAILSVSEEGVIVGFNASAEAIFGYRAEELIGQRLDVLLPQFVRARHDKLMQDYMKEPENARPMGTGLSVTGLHKSGREIMLEVMLSKLQVGDETVFLAAARDVTERHQAELEKERLQGQLLQSQKMESIGYLTGGIAHDFNNMLGAIIGYADLIKMVGGNGKSDERTLKYVEEILSAGGRAKELIAQMLLFSRQRPDAHAGLAPVIRVQPVLKEVMQMLRSSIPSTIGMDVQIEDDSIVIAMHPVQLHQVLMNLMINARDAMSGYGSISISLKKVVLPRSICISCHQNFAGEFVELLVRDNGKGMSEATIAKIFDPFYTTKPTGQGTGMGLPVVHGIVHGAGGHVMLESEPGLGTVFRILLPLVSGSAHVMENRQVVAESAGNPLQGLRIMVVDDERVMASMLEELLVMQGAVVRAFINPVEALRVFMHDPDGYDLVISDQTMPELSGLDMVRAMHMVRASFPAILCTGYSDNVDSAISQEHGISAFLYKPLNTKEIFGVIGRIVAETAHRHELGASHYAAKP